MRRLILPCIAALAVAILSLCVTTPAYPEDLTATVVKVVDGDTIKVSLDGPMPALFRLQSVRLLGCDTPEKHDKRPEVAALARMATAFTADLVREGETIALRDVRFDKYGGRLLAHVAVNGQDLCAALVTNDPPLAKPYTGGRKEW